MTPMNAATGARLLLSCGFAALLFGTAAMAGMQPDACSLLSPADIRKVTGEDVTNTKATAQSAGQLRSSQCFYTLPTFADSISLTLTGPDPVSARSNAARELWRRRFHGGEEDQKLRRQGGKENESEEDEAAAKAVPVTGIGDEAFWVHSFVGNLYVRKGGRFLRISLGGKMSDEERQARAKALAVAALTHLR